MRVDGPSVVIDECGGHWGVGGGCSRQLRGSTFRRRLYAGAPLPCRGACFLVLNPCTGPASLALEAGRRVTFVDSSYW